MNTTYRYLLVGDDNTLGQNARFLKDSDDLFRWFTAFGVPHRDQQYLKIQLDSKGCIRFESYVNATILHAYTYDYLCRK